MLSGRRRGSGALRSGCSSAPERMRTGRVRFAVDQTIGIWRPSAGWSRRGMVQHMEGPPTVTSLSPEVGDAEGRWSGHEDPRASLSSHLSLASYGSDVISVTESTGASVNFQPAISRPTSDTEVGSVNSSKPGSPPGRSSGERTRARRESCGLWDSGGSGAEMQNQWISGSSGFMKVHPDRTHPAALFYWHLGSSSTPSETMCGGIPTRHMRVVSTPWHEKF